MVAAGINEKWLSL